MSKTPFMPLWVADFLAKTLDLDAKETGAYMLLLMAMWTHGGSLPDDQKKLQRVARIGREWPKVWAAIAHYFTARDGRVYQDRLTEELQKVNAKREVNAHAGSLGGRAKALKDKEPSLANATVSLQHSEPEPDKKKEDTKVSKKGCSVRSVLLSFLREETADAYIAHRKAKRAKLTERAAQLIAKKLAGHPDPDSVIENSIMNGWTGVFPDKPQQRSNGHDRMDAARRAAERFERERGLDQREDYDASRPLLSARPTLRVIGSHDDGLA